MVMTGRSSVGSQLAYNWQTLWQLPTLCTGMLTDRHGPTSQGRAVKAETHLLEVPLMTDISIPSAATPARPALDPKNVAALQAKVTRLVLADALTAAPHTYHH